MQSDTLSSEKGSIFQCLKDRFIADQIYTYAGDILVAIKPYKDLDIFNKNVSDSFSGLPRGSVKTPHAFAVAREAYDLMMLGTEPEASNQCIVMRGECGSGKTETTKLLLKHWALSNCQSEVLQKKLVQIHTVLEAFGNAGTIFNCNASRFGMALTLYFTQGQVAGLKVNEYLLDKWRVTDQYRGETNFHIFYYMLAGQGLDPSNAEYRFLNDQKAISHVGMNLLKSKYQAVVNAMTILGFSQQEQSDISILLSAILNLGNINFRRSKFEEVFVEDSSKDILQNFADLLGLDYTELEDCLLSVVVPKPNGEQVHKRFTRDEAEDCRDSIARAIYHRLFLWLVYQINVQLVPNTTEKDSGQLCREIAVVDFFGMEALEVNSFEQFYMNFTEELLHNLFAMNISKVKEEECLQEGIHWVKTCIPESYVAELYTERLGLMSLLDDCTITKKENEDSLVDEIITNHSDHPNLILDTASPRKHCFTIIHFNKKEVTYDVRGWMDKNRNFLSTSISQLMQKAENALLSLIFKAKLSARGTMFVPKPQSGKKKKPNVAERRSLTATTHIKNSLQALLEKLSSIQPLFICCIKPNILQMNEPVFDDKIVLSQLASLGISEAISICKSGFTKSMLFEEFMSKYEALIDVRNNKSDTLMEKCSSILNSDTRLNGWKMGKTKVFLKYTHPRVLTQLLDSRISISAKKQSIIAASYTPVIPKDKRSISVPAMMEPVQCIYSEAQPVAFTPVGVQPVISKVAGSLSAGVSPPFGNRPVKPQVGSKSTGISPGQKLYPSLYSLEAKCEGDSDSSESDFEVLEVDFRKAKLSKEDMYGEIGSRNASVLWFKATQAGTLRRSDGQYAEWFHGIISRATAESLLKSKQIGSFLIRVGESRLGYSLSFKDGVRFRHYMIDQLDNGNYQVGGEFLEHNSLIDLVEYHRKNKLRNWDGLLTTPCSQNDGECNYAELVISKEEEMELKRLMNVPRLEASAPGAHYLFEQVQNPVHNPVQSPAVASKTPPALPERRGKSSSVGTGPLPAAAPPLPARNPKR